MPLALGKQTSRYIGMRVREAMEQDFSPPIKELFQAPTANLERATREARSVTAEVRKAIRFHAFSWLGSIFALGILLGASVVTFWNFANSTKSRSSSPPFSGRSRRPLQPRIQSRHWVAAQKGVTGIEADFGLECGL
ncbi:MAG: hypothetical protein ABI197_14215 [Granulicella sp.]